MTSEQEFALYYDTKNGFGIDMPSGVCTQEAKNKEKLASSEYYSDTKEDVYYQNLSDQELDKVIFTEFREKAREAK